jgi:hypothetical protein
VTSAKGWPAVGGEKRWGFVKLGHTDPTKSNSGLQALYLMMLEATGKTRLAVEDLLDPKHQAFVRGIEKGVTTVWSDHPAALLAAPWVRETQRGAAREYLAYLRSKPAQMRALDYGFRPADTSVKVVTPDAQNPFTRFAADGITVEVPAAVDMPDGPVVRNLMMMWTRLMQP